MSATSSFVRCGSIYSALLNRASTWSLAFTCGDAMGARSRAAQTVSGRLCSSTIGRRSRRAGQGGGAVAEQRPLDVLRRAVVVLDLPSGLGERASLVVGQARGPPQREGIGGGDPLTVRRE
jgi:hypothetical protein